MSEYIETHVNIVDGGLFIRGLKVDISAYLFTL